MPMLWPKLLSDHRCPKPGEPPRPDRDPDPFRSPFEADYDRVVYSPAFRCLSRKTQVHPMALNDHVHTRLTHSLEVASVGRSLGHRLAKFLIARNDCPGNCTHDLLWIIQAACLAHDIGNPPFGHAGEYAIREWVKGHPTEVFGNLSVDPGIRADWELFEGNAQGFRIAARPDNSQTTGYLRLTFATLGAMIKYPWASTDPLATEKEKFNVFSTEKNLFEMVAAETGMLHSDGRIVRHPLSFLTEAADDICYRILDLEDAVEMGIVAEKRVRDLFLSMFDSARFTEYPLPFLRGKAIEALIQGVWAIFERDYPAIMNGNRQNDLKSDFNPTLKDAVREIKKIYTEIFADRTKVAAELGAYKTLGRIIKAMCTATQRLAEAQNYDTAGFLAQRCLELAWGETYARKNQSQPYAWWLHQTMDYVSALTDNYARQLSREIEGT